MKSKLKLLPVLTLCASPVITRAATNGAEAGGDQSQTASDAECKNPAKSKCPTECGGTFTIKKPEGSDCPDGSKSTASLIINNTFEFSTTANDYRTPSASASCGSCSGGDATSDLPSLSVTRLIRPRYNAFTPKNLWGSFGNGQYWQEIDRSIFFNSAGVITVLDPRESDKQIYGTFDSSRGTWADLADESFVSINLLDDTDSLITSKGDRRNARHAIITYHDGSSDVYELLWKRTGDKKYNPQNSDGFGRLISSIDRNGNALTIDHERAIEADGIIGDASMTNAEKLDLFQKSWKKSAVTDAYGKKIDIENIYDSNFARYFISKLTFPNGEQTTYEYSKMYWYEGFLTKVNHPDGSISTRSAESAGTGLVKISHTDSSAAPSDQVKTYYVTKSTGTSSDGGTSSQVPALIRAVVNGADEIRYANREYTDPSTGLINDYIYEGGNRVIAGRYIDAGGPTDMSYVTSPEAGDGFYSSDISTWERQTTAKSTGYDDRGYNTGSEDALGRSSGVVYNQLSNTAVAGTFKDGSTNTATLGIYNKPVVSTDTLGRITLRNYDLTGNLLTTTKGLTAQTLVEAQALVASADLAGLRQLSPTTQHLYNTRGQVIETREPLYDDNETELHTTKFSYDSDGFLIKKTLAKDTSDQAASPELTYSYDTTGRIISSTDALGRTSSYTYDSRNRLTTTTYSDGSTELTEFGESDSATANLVVATTDRNGIQTTYAYDSAQRRIETIVAAGLPEQSIGTCTYLPGTSKKLTVTRNGDTMAYTYDFANRKVATTVHADANTTLATTSEFDQLDRLRSSTDAYGRSTYYLYDQNDRLIKTVTETVPGALAAPDVVESSSQTSSTFTYTLTDLAGNTLDTEDTHKVSYTDPRDLFLDALQRDDADNATYLITETVYDSEGQRLISTDARGNSTWTEYDTLGRSTLTIVAVGTPSEIRSEQDYDTNSNVVESRSPRHFTEGATITGVGKDQYTYTGRNMRATHTTAVGSSEEATQSWSYLLDGRNDESTDFRGNLAKQLWHICCGRLQASIQQDGTSTTINNTDFVGNTTHTATVSSNPNGNWHDPVDAETLSETTTRYDGRGRPTHTTRWLQPLGSVDDDARLSLGDSEGIPIATDPTIGLTTTYTYDEDLTDGIGIDADYASQITELTARYGYNPFAIGSNGHATSMTNPAGETSVQIQDGAGRTILSINPEGDISTMDYDEVVTLNVTNNDLTVNAELLATSSTDANGNTNTSYTDGAGRTLLAEDAIGNFAAMAYNNNSSLVISRDANGLGQNCDFDALNRDIACADLQEIAEGNRRTKEYNAASQVLTSTNADGETITNIYDARSRMTSSTDANNITTGYAYDANNNLITLTDGKGEDRQWFYDERNLATTKTYPSTSGNDFYTTSYDALGRPVIKTDQQGDTCTSIYDLASRMTEKQYHTGGSSLESTDTFEYDAASRVITTHKGRYDVTTEHTYALDSMPLTETLTADGRTYTSSRDYDLANRPLSHIFPSGEATSWAYDARNLVNTVAYDGDLVTTNTYDAGYRLTDQAFGNGLNREINYDRDDNLRSSDRVVGEDDLRLSYTYDADKQITAENIVGDVLQDTSFTASYDAGNRISSWNRANNNQLSNQTWNYDDAGNWNNTSKTVGTQTETENRDYNAADGITSIAGNATVQDDKGNLTEFEINSKEYEVEYDLDNRINNVDIDGTDVSYRYDAMGRRVLRQEGSASSSTTAMIWWGNSECAEHKHTATQTVIQNDIMEHPSRLNSVIARAVDGSKNKLEWYHKNYLDHVYAVSDDSGDILEHYRYTAFGEVTIYNENGQIQSESQIDNDILWNTRRQDEVTGLYLYKYRHYSAELGRWLGRDPIEEDGGANLYNFARNNVVNQIDYLGLWVKVEGTDHTWCADSEFDTLHSLAESYGDKDSWSCLWPVDGTEDSGAYDWGVVQVGDKYDASNLAQCPDNKHYFNLASGESAFANAGKPFNVTLSPLNGDDVVDKLRSISGEGATPITELFIFGHSWNTWDGMSGVSKKKFNPSGTRGIFFFEDLMQASVPPSFSRAKSKKGPIRCWFCRESSVRLAGCKTNRLAKKFSKQVLRKGSISWGTQHLTYVLGSRYGHANNKPGTTERDGPITYTLNGAGIHSKTWIGHGGEL